MDKITITQRYGYAYNTDTQSSMRVWWIHVKGVGCFMSFPCIKKQSARQLRVIRKKVNIHQKLSGPAARHYFYNVANFGDFS